MSELLAFIGGGVLSLGVGYGAQRIVRRFMHGGGRPLADELRTFFGTNTDELPIVTRSFPGVELPNLQIAISRYVEENLLPSRVIGYTSMFGELHNNLRGLIGAEQAFGRATVGAAQYRDLDVDVDEQMQCVENGIHLLTLPEGKIAAHVRVDRMNHGNLELEVMATHEELATSFVEQIRTLACSLNVYRGKVLSLECDTPVPGRSGFSCVRFHQLPAVQAEDIILPAETLETLQRNSVRFFHHAPTLRKAGRSVKRGLLLHGKPGTGKTFTARWLAQSLDGVTTILLSADHLQLVKECCQLARMLSPSLVIMEDVDLIATERDDSRHPAYQITLHNLMNEMDGLSGDTEILFLLTTNRPEAIETALSARPGRVDQAIEFPLPDAECRRRLLKLYGRGLELAVLDVDALVARTEGASPSFIQELVRKAALFAAEEGSNGNGLLRLTDQHFDSALRELVFAGGELTRNLLGFRSDA